MRSLWTLRPYFYRHRWRIIAGILFILVSNACATLVPKVIQWVIDDVENGQLRFSMLQYFLMIAAAGAIAAVSRFFIRITLIVMSRLIEYDLRQDLWAHVQRLPMRYFSSHSAGSIMAELTNDVNSVRMFLGPSVMYTIDHGSRFIMVLAVMAAIDWKLTLIGLIPLPLMSAMVWIVGHRIHTQFGEVQQSFSDLTARAQQTFHGIRVIKSYVREDHEYDAFDRTSRHYLDNQLRIARIEAFYRPLLWVMPAISIVLVLWLGGRKIIAGDPDITLGALTAFIVYLSQLAWPMIALGWIVNITQRAAASMKRLLVLMNEPYELPVPEQPYRPAGADAQGQNAPPKHTPPSDAPAIAFENVSFRYTPDGPLVLEDISFTLPAGGTLGIVGRTGSGKTTLVNLIPRLFDVANGRVKIDGVDVREWDLETLRQQTGIAPQEAFLFSETLDTNLRYGRPDASQDDRDQASTTAQLHKDVLDFPNQYDTILGERGITLSGGQKQRASLARALLRQPPILILDDTLSAVDAETESAILHGLNQLPALRARVIISHRLSAVQDADQILVLEDGRIVERGTHTDLIDQGGRYATMYEKQRLEHELDVLN